MKIKGSCITALPAEINALKLRNWSQLLLKYQNTVVFRIKVVFDSNTTFFQWFKHHSCRGRDYNFIMAYIRWREWQNIALTDIDRYILVKVGRKICRQEGYMCSKHNHPGGYLWKFWALRMIREDVAHPAERWKKRPLVKYGRTSKCRFHDKHVHCTFFDLAFLFFFDNLWIATQETVHPNSHCWKLNVLIGKD